MWCIWNMIALHHRSISPHHHIWFQYQIIWMINFLTEQKSYLFSWVPTSVSWLNHKIESIAKKKFYYKIALTLFHTTTTPLWVSWVGTRSHLIDRNSCDESLTMLDIELNKTKSFLTFLSTFNQTLFISFLCPTHFVRNKNEKIF